MVKSNKRLLERMPINKKTSSGKQNDFSNAISDLHEEDSWVMVKKQRVTILIPALPVSKTLMTSHSGQNQLQAIPNKTVQMQQQFPVAYSSMLTVDKHDESNLLTPEKGTPVADVTLPPQLILSSPAQPSVNFRGESVNPNLLVSKTPKPLALSNTSKFIKSPRPLLCLDNLVDSIDGGGMLLNRRMRALNLERKLKKAGGLSKWLASLGLWQFIRIFQAKSLNKFQLVNLTMKKLKDMGTDAVGPRRKLMHAIQSIGQSTS